MKTKLFSKIPQIFIAVFVFTGILLYAQGCLLPTQQIVARSVFAEKIDILDQTLNDDAKEKIITHGVQTKKHIALTFDADMSEGMRQSLETGEVTSYADRRIIDHLIRNHLKATFFLAGMWIETYPQETKMMAQNSLFELANHSYSHPSFAGECYGLKQISSSEFHFEIARTQQLLKDMTGVRNKYFRFPGGCYDQTALRFVSSEGLETIHWDVVAHDGFNVETEQIISNVLTNVKNGSIIVMHLGGEANTPKTYEALQQITSSLTQQGFVFVKVSELLNPEEKTDSDVYSSQLFQMSFQRRI